MSPYYVIVFLTFLYSIYNYKNNLIAVIIILCFYLGLASFFGKIIENPYKILIVTLTIYAFVKELLLFRISRKERIILLSFLFFSGSFFLSAYLNQTYLSLTFSQFGKYIVPFLLFFIFNNYSKYNSNKLGNLKKLLFFLLYIQVILTIAKLIFIGIAEATVGSIAFEGGGVATPLPILGFLLIWLEKKGDLSRKDWGKVLALLFISVVSIKRAIWFIMPIMVFLFMVYIPKKKIGKRIFLVLPLIPLIFYLGIRLNPTLNKENLVWGSYDLDFTINYALKYSFGDPQNLISNEGASGGRGGATLMLLNKFFYENEINSNDIFGYGLQSIISTDYETFDIDKFNVDSRGSVTGILRDYISIGFLGVFFFLFYMFSLVNFIEERRIKYVMSFFILWDYFFYSGLVFTIQALSVLILFFIVKANYQKKIDLRLLDEKKLIKL